MITICSHFSIIAEAHKCVNAEKYLLAVSYTELMSVANNQGSRNCDSGQVTFLDFTYVAADCSVTSVGHAFLFTAYSYMLVLISVIVI